MLWLMRFRGLVLKVWLSSQQNIKSLWSNMVSKVSAMWISHLEKKL
uniref:Uncharacterized protein n=1 Tax=Brassica oleracea TaxID=3712 RepID=A0A3P6BYJ2_BRAOL|nr:unnamed protein product [Brassica oleracea]